MNTKHKHPRILLFSASMTLALGAGIFSYISSTTTDEGLHSAASSSGATIASDEDVEIDGMSGVAKRLQRRLSANGNAVPGIAMIQQSLDDRSKYLTRTIAVNVSDDSSGSGHSLTWTIDISKHPELITLQNTWATTTFGLDRDLFAEYLNDGVFGDAGNAQSVVVKETYVDGKKVMRVSDVKVARDGFDYDIDDLANAVESALRNDKESITFKATFKPGTVQYAADGTVRELSLLSTGRSDFSNSPENRVWNVHKAIDERVNNIVVPKGAKFSFVDALDAPVTLEKGWKEGMGLFGGGAADTPGAGICQAATTVYRAAILAGLPIAERRNHSMFVDHYEPFGIGLDATVFPGFHDMRFVNDTPDVIFIQAYTVGDEAFVNFYGIPDDRKVALDGPYFNITPHRNPLIRPLDWDEIGWTRTVTYADGRTEEKAIVSTYYKGFLRSIKTKYAGTLGIELLKIKEPVATVATANTSY